MVFAVATLDTVVIYNTLEEQPKYLISKTHFATLSDMSWHNQTTLAISSMDGYITFCSFEDGELGTPQASSGTIFYLYKKIRISPRLD